MTDATRGEVLIAGRVAAASGPHRRGPTGGGTTGRRPGSAAASRPAHLVVVTAIAVFVALILTASAGDASSAPVYPKDFPDPDVLVTQNGYLAFSTQIGSSAGWINVPVLASADGRTGWAPPATGPDALRELPLWARSGNTWAPNVLRSPTTGQFILYYTVTDASTGLQCVSRAIATVASGPYTDSSSGPLVCQTVLGGSIDPDTFRAPNGSTYLLWKSDDNRLGHSTSLWSRKLSTDGLKFARGSWATRLLSATASWEHGIIEGPAMTAVALAGGYRYFLFYGAGPWTSPAAGIGYARCSGPLGPCTKVTTTAPWLTGGTGTSGVGPSGPSVWVPLGTSATATTQQLTYHAWSCAPGATCTAPTGYGAGDVRSMWTDTVNFSSGSPTIQ
jgi:Glycosyl hydrolases family 43